MKNALIIEDEKYSADRMVELVKNHTSLNVIGVSYSVESAKTWLDANAMPDVIFLDIQLGDGTGFDILDHLTAFPCIIFTTAFDEYTLRAFKYNSIDYLLKPIKPEELELAVKKFERVNSVELATKIEDLRKDIVKGYRSKFLIKTGLKYRSIAIREIAYFYSTDSTSYLKTIVGESLILDLSLDGIQESIDPTQFFRVNRHLIIHENSIESIDSFFNGRLSLDLSPKFDEDVIVSRDKVKLFKSWLDN
ncbi:MAG: LytTR family DNA-binding domain-containing protein [Cyclobacteriaceae bacterium]